MAKNMCTMDLLDEHSMCRRLGAGSYRMLTSAKAETAPL